VTGGADSAGLWPLVPAAAAVDAETVVRALELGSGGREGRPHTVAVMIATVDGRTTVDGRSVGLGCPADRALFRAVRAEADAMLVGAPTLAAERYARLIDTERRAARARKGRAPHPLVVTVSRRLDLDLGAIPVLREPGVDALVFTEADASGDLDEGPALHQMAPGTLTLTGVLEHLARAHGVRSVTCEGGPTLLARLVAEDCLDDLLLTVAPVLLGSVPAAPTLLGPVGLPVPAPLVLADVHRAGEHVFLHYTRRG